MQENQPVGAVVGTFSSTDPDAGDTFTYALVSGTGSADNTLFTILSSALQTAAVFDYESKGAYSIRVRTTDQGGLYTEKVLIIAVSNANEQPTDLILSSSSVQENQPVGTTVGTLSTIDPDSGNTFTYSLVGGTGSTGQYVICDCGQRTAGLRRPSTMKAGAATASGFVRRTRAGCIRKRRSLLP